MSTVPSFAKINVGTYANDSTGDSLRVAFEKVNQNFSNVWSIVYGNAAAIPATPLTIVQRDGNGSGFFNAVNVESVNVAGLYELPITAGTPGQALVLGANNIGVWESISSIVAGANSQVIFNSNGAYAGATGFTTDGNNVVVTGNLTIDRNLVLGSNTVVTTGQVFTSNLVQFTTNINQTLHYIDGTALGHKVLGIGYYCSAIDYVGNRVSTTRVDILSDDSGNIWVSQYSVLNSNATPAATFDGAVLGNIVYLTATGASSNVDVTISRTPIGPSSIAGNITMGFPNVLI